MADLAVRGLSMLMYRVRARDARIRVMRGQHQKRSTRDETIEPPTINIITVLSDIIQN